MHTRCRDLKHSREGLLFALLVAVAVAVRLAPAPYSSGSDIPQFEGFARTFLKHRACFYLYASGAEFRSERWPYNWPYPYGPVWIFIIGALKIFVSPHVKAFYVDSHYYVYVPVAWVLAVKSVLICIDILLGALIYHLVKGRRGWRAGFTASALYLLNPITIYESGIYGMFDQLAVFFLLLSLHFLLSSKFRTSGCLAAFSALTKQVVVPAFISEFVASWGNKRLTRFTCWFALTGLLLYSPFVLGCPSSIPEVIASLWSTVKPSYTYPIPYSFNGVSSLATYLHEVSGADFTPLIKYWFIPYLILQVLVLVKLLEGWGLIEGAYASYAVFMATYWRVNYQYFVTLVALALIVLYLTDSLRVKERIIILYSSLLLPAFWVFLYPTAWWFHAHLEHPNSFWVSFMESTSLNVFNPLVYVCYSLALTASLYLSVLFMLRGGRGLEVS